MKKYFVKTVYTCSNVEVDDNDVILKICPRWAEWRGKHFKQLLQAHTYQNVQWSEVK